MDFRSVSRMRHSYIIIDDFLDNPDKVRQSILDGGIELFNRQHPIYGGTTGRGRYSGRRTMPADKSYQDMFLGKLNSMLPFKLEAEDNPQSCCFAFQLSLEDDETWVHNDNTEWSGVLYLTPNAPIDSGTILFKEGTKPDPDKDDYNSLLTDTVGNVYNRLILFRGKLLPHRSNKTGFGDCLENGRLSQHLFFDEVK